MVQPSEIVGAVHHLRGREAVAVRALSFIAQRRKRPDRASAGKRGRPIRAWRIVARSLSVSSLGRRRPAGQHPAGESAHTESARPRRASSSETQPPMELPTRWALSMPSASRAAMASSMTWEKRAGRCPAALPPCVRGP